MNALPNPFTDSAADRTSPVADTAVASLSPPVDATANQSSTARGGQEAPAADGRNPNAAGLLADDLSLDDLIARGFDVDGFMNDIEPLPAFLIDPSPEYLQANEMIPMLAVLAGH